MRINRQSIQLIVLAVGLLLASSAMAQQTTMKIGVFDPNRVSAEAADALRAQQALQAVRDSKQQAISQQETAIQAQQQQLQQQALSLSTDRRIDMELNIQRQILEINAQKDLSQRELQLELAAAESRFNEQLRAVLDAFAKRESFDLILDTGAIAWAGQSADVTTALIDQFNQMFPVDGN
ncbi:MAG: OmpH family outer membrane protein [Acidobacteriota bacterium]|nr:OmpH family outer membrane protein [Acidobacteriota bacterium]